WQFAADFATRNRDAGYTGQGSRNCIYISKIHLQGVVRALLEPKGWYGRSGSHDGVNLGEGIAKVLSDQSSHFLPFKVIRVVIASGQNVGAKHDAALHFRPESNSSSFAVHGQQ